MNGFILEIVSKFECPFDKTLGHRNISYDKSTPKISKFLGS